MNLKCLLRGHRAAAGEIYNAGYYFSRCEGCGGEMIRSGSAWQPVPRGHRVVWKATPAWHSLQPDFGTHLPVLHRDSGAPAGPDPDPSWNRALVALGGRSVPADASEVRERETSPPILVVVALWAGLQLLFALRPR